MRAYIADRLRVLAPATVVREARSLDTFGRWLGTVYPRGAIYPDVLTKRLLVDFYTFLGGESRHGRPRADRSRANVLSVVQKMWAWAANEDDFAALMPPPRRIEVRTPPSTPTIAPTWAEADACVEHCLGWRRHLALVMRYTGLRVSQAMGLRWDDLDLGAATLRIRGELGKSRQERAGRIIPVSPHLVAEVKGWGVREGWLVVADGRAEDRDNAARGREIGSAWRRAGVREEAWAKRPQHAFRKCFVSGLIGAGAQREAVEHLVGHSLGIAGVYTDPEALGLREAAGMVPRVGGGNVEPLRKAGAK